MKSKLILLIAVCGLMLVSCQDNTPECYYHKKTVDLQANPNEWAFDTVAKQFFCRFDMPEVTSYVYHYGEWSVNREFNHKKAGAYQVALPMNIFMTETTQEERIDFYTQYIDYRLGIGYVDIQLTNSDRLYAPQNPEGMHFRLQANDETIDLTVNQANWNFDETLRQYYCRIEVPQITSDIYNYGQFTICREFEYGTADAYQVPLPMSLFLSDTIPVNTPIHYTQGIDYRMGVGYMDIQVTNSDYLYDYKDGKIVPPDTMNFRVVVTY